MPKEIKDQFTALHFNNQLLIPDRVAAIYEDLFKQLCLHGGPEQKMIIFCSRDLQADRVVQHMNNLYSAWNKQQNCKAKDLYAFKCTANGGRDWIEPMRDSSEHAFLPAQSIYSQPAWILSGPLP